jgi:polyisoprenyl-teichoic acid--peptidoglycan teichoic acid transferase
MPITRPPVIPAGTLLRRMAPDDKPYRVYRGGRVKGKVPAVPGKGRPQPGGGSARGGGRAGRLRRFRLRRPGRLSWKQIVLIVLVALLVLIVAWGVAGYLAFSSGVSAANRRLDQDPGARATLAKSNGFLLTHATTILLLGTDTSTAAGRSGDRHADSIMIVRTDPSHHRLAYLSIPRDMLVSVPGVGNTKINASYQAGGAALAIRTVHDFTGIPIDHVVILDFNSFKDLIDAEGGITIDVPRPILSNRFDCPYKTQARCLEWTGWRFQSGPQHMNGERALIYSRIRENQLDPSETDLTRAARQQAVAQAAAAKLTSFSTLLGLPFDGSSLMSPLSTDLSTAQLLELGWVKFRSSSSHSLYCRLGGDAASAGGASVIIPSEDNRSVLAMWAGASAPQPPTTTFGPGCRTGQPLQ